MTAVTSYRSGVQAEARDGFGRLLLAEWTAAHRPPLDADAAGVGPADGAGGAAVGGGDRVHRLGDAPSATARLQIIDLGHFTYLPLAGDGSAVARVTAQDGGGAWAKAGLMIRGSAQRGTPYAALMVTPGHGVRLQTGYESGGQGGGTAAMPRWLKLTRSGATVTGYDSADGRAWHRVGSVRLEGLPEDALAGMFVAVPDEVEVRRQFGGESVSGHPGDTRATFDHVSVSPVPPGASWRDRGTPGGPAADPTPTAARSPAGRSR